jgi:lipopolysaccharide biosynthesis protein
MLNLKDKFSLINEKRKNSSPFVSRRRYEEIFLKYNTLKAAISSQPNPLLAEPRMTWLKPCELSASELCIFVSYSEVPNIKSYVAFHVEAFLRQNIDVVLIINTDHPDHSTPRYTISPDISGICIRENKGFDFGAWSQVLRSIDTSRLDRIFWVNDSLFGPLCNDSFDKMIERIRRSNEDMIGLTENCSLSEIHLQSFFLSFNKKIIQSQEFLEYARNLWQLPTKSLVIDVYEKRLTQFVKNLGFSYQALFTVAEKKRHDLPYKFPRALFNEGFPYVKTILIKQRLDEGLATEFLSEHLPVY